MHVRIFSFINKNNILLDNQFGFRKNIGFKEALAHIINILYSNVYQSLPTVVTYLDLAKAFDTVQYKILYKKLSIHGFRGKIINLIKSYLTDRKQSVVNNVKSAYATVSMGLPQGTILGPLLFILYINDIFNFLPKDVIISYADDTAIVSRERTWPLARNKMVDYLLIVYQWLYANQLSLNLEKTVFITYDAYKNSIPE